MPLQFGAIKAKLNQAVQRTGVNRLAQRQMAHPRQWALAADLFRYARERCVERYQNRAFQKEFKDNSIKKLLRRSAGTA